MASLAPCDDAPGSLVGFAAVAGDKQKVDNEVYHVVDDADICLVFSQPPSAKLFVSSEVLSRSLVAFAKLVSPPSDGHQEQKSEKKE